MTCKNCNSRNPIGNKFCRECGAKIVVAEGTLAAEEAARAEAERRTERAAILLSDAHLLAEQGKYLGAIPIAEEVSQLLPTSTTALSLLVTLYEHTDQQDKAIAVQERVVALNPDSPVDTLRLERLQRGERTSAPPATLHRPSGPIPTLRNGSTSSTGTAPTAPFPQWFPLAAAAVGGGFVLFLGFLAMTPGKKTDRFRAAEAPSVVISASPSPTSSPLTLNPRATYPPQQDPTRGGDPFTPLEQTRQKLQAEAAKRDATTANNAPATGVSASTAAVPLPNPKQLTGANNQSRSNTSPVTFSPSIMKVTPITDNRGDALPPISAGPPSGGNSNGGDGFGNGERVAAGPPATEQPAPSAPSTPRPGSYMRISVGPPAARPAPIAAAPPSNGNTADLDGDPLRRARTLQSMGRYNDAIGAYREAVSSGASEGDAQQGIGLCYQRLGDTNGARGAYRQAIGAYQGQIAAGRNASAAQRGINSCRAALEVLGGE